ncbi:hypothetical protein MTR_8g047050 [Medicago truncatula]|uniref:Uncharacterized protein n=1 Tax=Medicago truncatula TaxID=3880 RepID=A0A072TPR5_MEDTR|nr:hypothetical protein MTR_8g047050 [Medicago truncatula]
MRFPVDRKPERAVQAKIRDKKTNMKSSLRLYTTQARMSVSMSRKPGRAVHAKMRLKQKASNYIWPTTVPLGASAAVNDHLHQKRMLANSKFLGNVMITVFNVPPTNKITIFQAL